MAKSDMIVRVQADTKNYDANLAKASKTLKQFAADNLTASGAIKQTTAAMTSMAASVLSVTAAIGATKKVIGDMVRINMQFEQGTAVLASIMGKTTDEITALTDQAKQLGATTHYTAIQITELQSNLARLGFTQEEILNSTSAVQALATATGADLGEAANLAGAALRGFGLNATEMERVSSVLAVSTTKSALSFEKLATAVPIVAPVAKQFGFTIEDTVTLLGKLSDAGMDASSAATATRNIFLNMANSSGKLAQALGRPIKSMEDFAPALKELKDRGIDLNEMLDLTDKRSVTAFATFVDNADTLVQFKESITGCSEAMHDMESKQINTLQGSITILGSAWEGLMLSFGDSVNGPLKNVVESVTSVISKLTEMKKSGELAKIFNVVRISIESATAALVAYKTATNAAAIKSAFINGINSATKAIKAMNVAMLSNPYAAIAAAIAAVTVAVVGYVRASKDAEEASGGLSNAQKAQAQAQQEAQKSIAQVTGLYNRLKIEWQNLTTEQEKNNWIEENKSSFESLGLSIRNVVDADRALVTMSDKVVAALRSRAKANALQELYETKTREAVEASLKVAKFIQPAAKNAGDTIRYNPQDWQSMGLSMEEGDVTSETSFQPYIGSVTEHKLTEQGAAKVNAYYAKKAEEDAARISKQYIEEVDKIYGGMMVSAIQEASANESALGKLGLGTTTTTSTSPAQGNAKTKKDLEDELKELKKSQDLSTTKEEYDSWQKKIDEVKAAIVAITGETKKSSKATSAATKDAATLWQEYAKKIEETKTKLAEFKAMAANTSLGDDQRKWAEEQAKSTQDALDKLLNNKPKTAPSIEGPSGYSEEGISALRSEIQGAQKSMQMGSDEYMFEAERLVDLTTFENLLKAATERGVQPDPEWMASIFEDIKIGADVAPETWQAVVDHINELIEGTEFPPFTLDVKTGSIESAEKDMDKLKTNVEGAIGVFGQLGGAMQQLEDPGAQVAGIIMQAVANVAASFAKSLMGSVGPWDWIAAAIGGVSTMISTIAAIKSATSGGFANGGIVPGNSFSGDNLRTSDYGINAGELILNRAQQGAIAGQLQSNPMGNLRLSTEISGTNLRVVLNNDNRSKGGDRNFYSKIH